MKLTQEEVEHIARLARLQITDEEKKKYAEQLSAILDYVDKLKEVDVDGVKLTEEADDLKNIYREDEVADADKDVKKGILDNVPEKENNLIKVRGVFNE